MSNINTITLCIYRLGAEAALHLEKTVSLRMNFGLLSGSPDWSMCPRKWHCMWRLLRRPNLIESCEQGKEISGPIKLWYLLD
jgi:hypothetical protein